MKKSQGKTRCRGLGFVYLLARFINITLTKCDENYFSEESNSKKVYLKIKNYVYTYSTQYHKFHFT